MDIKTYIAAAVVALTAACSEKAPEALTAVNATDAATANADANAAADAEAKADAREQKLAPGEQPK